MRGFLAGGSVYFAGIVNRTILGVAAIATAHHFGIGPVQLSAFVVLPVGMYAVMQIPSGVLADAFGPRRLLLIAAAVLAASGVAFAFAPNYPTALVARGLVGCGDGMTYISVLRYAAGNFAPRRFPMIVSFTTLFSFGGNILTTSPSVALLHSVGWRATFLIVALIPVASGLAVALFIAPQVTVRPKAGRGPSNRQARFTTAVAQATARVGSAWRTPGTRLGFWVHFSCMCPGTIFGVLWGLPYLVSAGFSQSAGGAILLMSVLVGAAFSLGVGALIAVRPIVRVPLAFGMCALTIVSWTLLLAAGGDHPDRSLIAVLVAVMAATAPVSSIGFVLARDYNEHQIVGTATGVVNCAGFFATIVGAAGVGLVLDLAGNTGPSASRLALSVAFVIQTYGVVRMAVWWRRVRADSLGRQRRGLAVPVAVVQRRWDRPSDGDLGRLSDALAVEPTRSGAPLVDERGP